MGRCRSRATCARALSALVSLAWVWLAAPNAARGWFGREHRAIGVEAYTAACRRLAPQAEHDPQAAIRYQIACGNLEVQAFLYGQSNRVGGDFLGDPASFLSAAGASIVSTRKNYLRLALTNSAHFQPLATREWRDLHAQAVAGALAASRQQGVEQVGAFEQVFYQSAVGDHFLQDSFAAGHMGFNRPGSSAGASKVFHDEWSKRGRWVSNRRGQVWKTYGDGLLDRSPASREHAVAAATESVYGVLYAFVRGVREPAADLAVWQEVAFTIEDPELVSHLEEVFEHEDEAQGVTPPERDLVPLLAVMRPAVTDAVIAAWSEMSTTFDEGGTAGAFLVGGQLAVPFLPARLKTGVGIGFDGALDEARFAVDVGLVTNLLLTVDGLFSHEIDAGALFLVGDSLDASLRLAYRVNLEAGNWMLRFEIGPAIDVDDTQLGLFAGVGLGWIIDAAGGGAFR